jgi:hypothetical protein
MVFCELFRFGVLRTRRFVTQTTALLQGLALPCYKCTEFTMIFWPHLVLIVVPEVTTSKYTLLSFLPLVTFEQFQKPGADILSRMFSFMNV